MAYFKFGLNTTQLRGNEPISRLVHREHDHIGQYRATIKVTREIMLAVVGSAAEINEFTNLMVDVATHIHQDNHQWAAEIQAIENFMPGELPKTKLGVIQGGQS